MNLSQVSLRTRARFAYSLLALVGMLGVVLGGVSFNRVLDQRRRLAGHLDPAALAAERWFTAWVDQESGLRGYALSADADYLEPYTSGRAAAVRIRSRIRASLADEPALLALAEDFDARTTEWTDETAEPLIAEVRSQGATAISDQELRDAKASFDRVRASYATLVRGLDLARDDARAARDARTRELAESLISSVVVLALGVIATWIILDRWVLRPLAALGADARRVAAGDLDHVVPPTGAPEIAALSHDMEAMRRRIVAEVAVVEAARVRLEHQATDLARSNQELEQFAYVASHDLQEPLRKISGFCQLLERRYRGRLDERADEYIAFAVDGAKRMQSLINDLLAFSRVGRTTAAFSAVDLTKVATDAAANLQASIDEAGGRVEIGPLPTVWGDASLLEALFQNLIANAVKFRGEDPPVVQLGAVRSTPDGGPGAGRAPGRGQQPASWTLTCSDNGIGIEPEYAERVFVIFQRLHTRDVYDGTGIGLAMCRKIVEFHGGSIWVEPSETGATICWTLPDGERKMPSTAPSLHPSSTPPTSPPSPGAPEPSSPTIPPPSTEPAGATP